MNHFTKEQKLELVNSYPFWWHTIDLGDEIVTPGSISPKIQETLSSIIPRNLSGKSVLDIGTWDGYYAFECEKRGAEVTSVDMMPREGFQLAKKLLGSNVRFVLMDLFDLPRLGKTFDVTIFFGVLYHVKNPLGALEIVRSVTSDTLLLESYYIKTEDESPIMRFYPGDELTGDPTNWWGPNIKCILDMLHVAGFEKADVSGTYLNGRTGGRVYIVAH